MSFPTKADPSGASDGTLNPMLGSCSTPKCEISAYVCDNSLGRPPIRGAGVQATNDGTQAQLGGKTTDGNGHAVYSGVAPASYTVTVTLTAPQLIKYAWPSTDGASTSSSNAVYPGAPRFYPFTAILLARPKIQVLWQEDSTPVGGVKVTLSPNVALTDTVDNVGIAELAAGTRGLRANSFNVIFTFPSKNVELMDGRLITVDGGSTNTYPFHIRKCWVEFVVTDKFANALEEADYVLSYPDGRPAESGSLTAGLNGKLRKEVPPGDYKFELKWLSQATWSDTAAEIGKPLQLSALATGYTAGDITFEIFDACAPTGTALDTVTASTLVDKIATAEWTPDIGKLAKVTSGAVLFSAKAGTQSAVSASIPIAAKRVFTVTGPDDAPLETDLVLNFSNGPPVAARSTGGTAAPLVPLGQLLVSVKLAQTGVYPSFQLEGSSDKQGCYIPKPG